MKLNSKSPAGTTDDKSTNDDAALGQAQLAQNHLLGDVFRLFCSTDSFRKDMLKPFSKNGKVYATDAYTVIFTDEVNCNFEYEKELEKCPNVDAIIPIPNKRINVDLSKYDFEPYKTADEFEFIGEDIQCSACFGEGVVEWEFEQWTKEFECPKCYGSGFEKEKRKRKTGKKTFGNALVKFNDCYFNMKNFYRILQAQNVINQPINFIYSNGDKNGLHVFEIGYCRIMIMPQAIYDNNPVSDFDGILNIA